MRHEDSWWRNPCSFHRDTWMCLPLRWTQPWRMKNMNVNIINKNYQIVTMSAWLECELYKIIPLGRLPHKSDRGDRWKLWKEPQKGTRTSFCGRGSKYPFSPLRSTNSKRYQENSTVVILDFNSLSGTKPYILTPKRYNAHHFYIWKSPGLIHTYRHPYLIHTVAQLFKLQEIMG